MKCKRIFAIIISITVLFSCFNVFAVEMQIDTTNGEEMSKFYDKFLDTTIKNYRFDVTKEQLLDAAMKRIIKEHPEMFDVAAKGAYDALDTHSEYLTADEYTARTESLDCEFYGIGVSVTYANGKAIVTGVVENSPSAYVGIKAGDIISKVDDENVIGYGFDKIISLIRGKLDTEVSITVERNGTELTFNMTRQPINTNPITYEILENDCAYVKISTFDSTADEQFDEIMNKLGGQGIKNIILDLRNNGGGFLTAAVSIASYFVPQSELILWESHKNDKVDMYYHAKKKNYHFGVVVLVNENSASASEIVTGSIQDHKVGKIVGTKTYGKGTVQTSKVLKNCGAMWLTIAQYNLPNGENIDGVGITPDYVVENTFIPVDTKDFEPLTASKVLNIGDSGKDVLALKQRLSALGLRIVNMDDVYDDQTFQYVELIQQSTGLFPYGVADITTQNKIIELVSQATTEVDNQLEKAKSLAYSMK